jgi:hypothetical protein
VIAVLDGVCHCFPYRDPDPVAGVIVARQPPQRLVEHDLHQLDVLEPAAQR